MSDPSVFQLIFEGIPAIIKLRIRLWAEDLAGILESWYDKRNRNDTRND